MNGKSGDAPRARASDTKGWLSMISKRIVLSEKTGAYMDTYLLSPSDQIQLGVRRPVVLVCPGGGYLRTSDQEAEQVALHFNILGFHAAVVRYTCGETCIWPNPLLELAQAVRTFRQHAKDWFVREDRIAVCGFSAGGHLCGMMSTRYADAAAALGVPAEEVRPDAAIMGYPAMDLGIEMYKCSINDYLVGEVDPAHPERSVTEMYQCALCKVDGEYRMDFGRPMCKALTGTPEPSPEQIQALSPNRRVAPDTAPAFVWTTSNDDLVPASNALSYVNALWENGVPCEFHMFAEGHHGLSIADETVAVNSDMINPEVAAWVPLCHAWLKKRDFTLAL